MAIKLLKYTGNNEVLDPNDRTGNTVLVPPAEFNAMVSELEREEAALALEENILDQEIGGITGTLSSLVKSIADAERIAESNCLQQKNVGNAACNNYKNNKKEANCKVAVAKAYNDCMNSTFDTKSDLQTKYTAQLEIKTNKSRAKADVKKMRAERKAMITEAKVYKKITKANGKSYKMMTNADANLVLAGQGIDAKGNRISGVFNGLTDLSNSISSIWGGGSAASSSNNNTTGAGPVQANQSNNNTILIIGGVIVLGVLYFLTNKKR